MPAANVATKTHHNLYLSQIKAILEQVFTPKRSGAGFDCQIYLFGSRATDQYHDVSDFDIGVLASTDPVAIDRAVLDLVAERSGRSLEALSYPDRDGRYQLGYAESMGLGADAAEIVTVSV